jgi:hypothetical protein
MSDSLYGGFSSEVQPGNPHSARKNRGADGVQPPPAYRSRQWTREILVRATNAHAPYTFRQNELEEATDFADFRRFEKRKKETRKESSPAAAVVCFSCLLSSL